VANTTFFSKDGLRRASESISEDFVAIAKGKKGKLKKLDSAFNLHVKLLTEQLSLSLHEEIGDLLKANYMNALDEVKAAIVKGVKGTEIGKGKSKTLSSDRADWKSYNPRYYSRKLKENKKNAKKFWVKTGATGADFNSFSKTYRSKVQHLKNSASLKRARKLSRPAGVFRMTVDFTLPKPQTGGKFFERIFHDAFFRRHDKLLTRAFAMGSIGGTDMEIIFAMLESGRGSQVRPVVASIMKKHGEAFHKEYKALLREIQQRSLQDTLAAGGIQGLKIK